MAWQVNNVSSAAGTASALLAAGGANTRWVINAIAVSVAAGATAQTPLTITVVQDAAGTALTLWSGVLSAPVNSSAAIAQAGLWIEQTVAGKTLTIAFSGAGQAGVFQAVSMSGGATSG